MTSKIYGPYHAATDMATGWSGFEVTNNNKKWIQIGLRKSIEFHLKDIFLTEVPITASVGDREGSHHLSSFSPLFLVKSSLMLLKPCRKGKFV